MTIDLLKELWINIFYALLCVFLPCIIYQRFHSKKNKKNPIPVSHYIWTYIFIFYLYLVLQVTGIPSIWEIGNYGSLIRLEEISLIPFQSKGLTTYALNVIMFMPLGFLLPFIWKQWRSLLPTLLTGLVFSLIIELTQLFNRRLTDIDDLMMNTLGTVIGYGIWLLYQRVFGRKKKTSLSSKEPIAYISLAILGIFLLCNIRFFLKLFYPESFS